MLQEMQLSGLFRILGIVSYPLYAIHWLTLYIFVYVGYRMGLPDRDYAVIVGAHFVAAPLIAYGVAKFYEAPILRMLRGGRSKRLALRAPEVGENA